MLEGVASQLPELAVTDWPTARVPEIVGITVFVGPAASAARRAATARRRHGSRRA
jgi:hypothetical protein